jgi:hypothetical protein
MAGLVPAIHAVTRRRICKRQQCLLNEGATSAASHLLDRVDGRNNPAPTEPARSIAVTNP